ncbi:MAG TPA: GNAT family N-acetyltransferase [Candidatus Polarisedimenticolaceae bacterium]|nr:GNAT family N-acetyltransferase [Candidatus Polarisedimenticolaceae bacterium]
MTDLRPARRDDLEAMIETARRSWLSAFAQTAPFELIAWWTATDRARALYEASWNEMHVLRDGGLVAGILHVKDAEINGLWVHPLLQGRGIGAALLCSGEGMIRAAGHDRAWLTCSGFNERALAFYRRHGYGEKQRERTVHASGVSLEDIRMERTLD